MKSLQNMLNEAMGLLTEDTVTASAYCQARHKLKHTAFIELNQKAVVNTLYSDDQYQTFWGFRLLAIDGSKIVLPDNTETQETFGTIAWKTKTENGTEIQGEQVYAQASVLYDVLNNIALDATLGKATAYEVDLAIEHLQYTQLGDLLIMDRNFPSYRMLAELSHRHRQFVIRCSSSSFETARQMLKGGGADSQLVTLTPCAKQAALIKQLGLPMSLRVRFVRVPLSTGDYEVLVTSLLNETEYPTNEFLTLYHFRWGVETFYGLLKTRLELENFTGTSTEAIKQDFYATIYLSGLESLLTATAQTQLDAKKTKYPQKVNRAVSFNAIKNEALALLWSDMETQPLLEKLTALFLTNPVSERKHRNSPRVKSSDRKLLNFHKRQKKHCF